MDTKEIMQNEWLPFLNEFSKQHQGDIATMEIIGDDIGAQIEGRALPFAGVSVEKAGTENSTISVMLGIEPTEHLEHRIYEAEHLRIASSADGIHDALEIEAADGTRTILQVQPIPVLS